MNKIAPEISAAILTDYTNYLKGKIMMKTILEKYNIKEYALGKILFEVKIRNDNFLYDLRMAEVMKGYDENNENNSLYKLDGA